MNEKLQVGFVAVGGRAGAHTGAWVGEAQSAMAKTFLGTQG